LLPGCPSTRPAEAPASPAATACSVWYEEYVDIKDAIQRETSLKRWLRQWTIELIEKTHPEWFELFRGIGW
jgi:predicted GIY-YIG superfamily endonuclease